MNRSHLIDLLYAYTGKYALDYDIDAVANDLINQFGDAYGHIPEGTALNDNGELDDALARHDISRR